MSVLDIQRRQKYKLQYRVNAVFSIALALILLAVIATSIWLSSRELIAKDHQLVEKVGESIILSLQKNIEFSENIVAMMASLAQANRNRESLKKQLSFQMKAMAANPQIAGGGVWPSPYSLDKKSQKASLFWLRESDHSFTFSDAYNQPNAIDYFIQEWYLPVQYSKKEGCYWSRSYTDEYSLEPMVTCSKNLLIDNTPQGVATVDISLKGLAQELEMNMQHTQGYAFVLDRNDAFIAAPSEYFQKSILKTTSPAIVFDEPLSLLSERNANFQFLAPIIQTYRKNTRSIRDPRLSDHLVKVSADISFQESINIVDYLLSQDQSLNVQRLTVEKDPILQEEVELVLMHMPNTDWIVALVIPERLIIARAKDVSLQLLLVMGVGILLGSVFLSYQLHHMLVKPLRSIISILRAGQDKEIPLNDISTDELFELAEAYNKQQRALVKSNAVLVSAKQHYQSVLNTAIEGILSLDSQYHILEANPAALNFFASFQKDLIGHSFSQMLSEKSQRAFNQWVIELADTQGQHKELCLVNPTSDIITTIECSASASRTLDAQFITLFFRDISERKINERALKELATKDNLTKLANRNAFNQSFAQMLKMADRQQTNIALLFIDLDYFKAVNDTFGHLVGDELLVQVAKKLVKSRRETDLVARLGGDEFAIILSHFKQIKNSCAIAQNIIDELRVPFLIDGNECQIGASIGIAIYPDHSKDINSLINQADSAMYQAKEAGRNNWRLFANEQHEQQQRLLQLTLELEHAIKHQQLRLYLQPIQYTQPRQTTDCEALVRWEHPTQGLLVSEDFINIAHSSGLIIELGNWVLEEACRTLATCDKQNIALGKVAVEISEAQLQRGQLLDTSAALLEKYQLSGQRFIFTITEALLMNKECTKVLQQLASLKIGLAIDDFGSGYSSLSYLQDNPVNILKIAPSSVAKLQRDSQSSICRTIIMLAHSLNIEVIGEGVETPLQQQLLTALECDAQQGDLISKPLPRAAFIAWIKRL